MFSTFSFKDESLSRWTKMRSSVAGKVMHPLDIWNALKLLEGRVCVCVGLCSEPHVALQTMDAATLGESLCA